MQIIHYILLTFLYEKANIDMWKFEKEIKREEMTLDIPLCLKQWL